MLEWVECTPECSSQFHTLNVGYFSQIDYSITQTDHKGVIVVARHPEIY